MDAQRAAHLRALVEAALQTDAAAVSAQAACDAHHKELDRCREKRRNAAIELQNALGNSQLVYGNSIVYVGVGSDGGTAVRQVPLERLPSVDPPAPPPPPPAPAPEPVAEQKPPAAKPQFVPPAGKGQIKQLGK